MNVAGLTAPLKLTVAPLTKPMPLTVSVNAGPPAVALVGERLVMTAPTIKLAAAEVPPLGFMTVMGYVPNVPESVAINLAVS